MNSTGGAGPVVWPDSIASPKSEKKNTGEMISKSKMISKNGLVRLDRVSGLIFVFRLRQGKKLSFNITHSLKLGKYRSKR
jgi:hypothetical protein